MESGSWFVFIKFVERSSKLITSYKGKSDYDSMKTCFDGIKEKDQKDNIGIEYMDICQVK